MQKEATTQPAVQAGFQAFVADIEARCDVPPDAAGATIVGGYR